MSLKRDYSPRNKKGGGRKAAALLYVAAISAVLLTLLMIHALLGPRDRIAGFVPADAIIYLHAQGRKAVSEISDTSLFIPDNGAVELGLFALELDEGQVWTAALMWSRLSPPTAEEIESLDAAGAVRIAPTFYILRTGDGPIILSEGWNGSLSETKDIKRALATMSSVSRIQAYIDTDALFAETLDPTLFPVEPGPMVLALAPNGGKVSALVAGVSEAARYPKFLGFRLPDDRKDRKIPEILHSTEPPRPGHDGPSISLTTDANSLNPIPLLFNEVESLRAEAGVPESIQLELSRMLITGRFSGPLALTIWPQASTGKGPSFAAYLPEVDPADLKSEVLGYLSASFPKKSRLDLPDGNEAIEFIVEPGLFQRPTIKVPGDDDRPWQDYPMTAHRKGSLIASDTETLNQVLTAGTKDSGQARCITGSWPTLTIDGLPEFVPADGVLGDVLRFIPLKNLVIQRIGDNITFFCGYQASFVDNLQFK